MAFWKPRAIKRAGNGEGLRSSMSRRILFFSGRLSRPVVGRLLFLHALLFMAACAKERIHVTAPQPPPHRLVVLGAEAERVPYRVDGHSLYPLPEAHGFVQEGKASWYGGEFHGRPTSSGEVFDTHKRTGAHNTLPLGTYVEVTNLQNRRKTVVRINDRGPFVKGRILDLSFAAAREIDMIGPGTAQVRLVALGRQVDTLKTPTGYRPVLEAKDFNGGAFSVQVGAFREEGNAIGLADRLKVIFDYVDVSVAADEAGRKIYRVRVSKSKTLPQAEKVEKKLEEMGFEEAFIVSL